jgi:hypothetical protein
MGDRRNTDDAGSISFWTAFDTSHLTISFTGNGRPLARVKFSARSISTGDHATVQRSGFTRICVRDSHPSRLAATCPCPQTL